MRVGQNPAKFIDHVPQPARVTVAVVTYIPFLSGYYAHSLEVLKVCLGSLWANTPRPYDLLVFDNASCPEVRAYLDEHHAAGSIQYLLLSEQNMGKGGAWNMIFRAAPGEVIAYADSDIYFRPGWLEDSLQVLETYPRVGMVTGRPLRQAEQYYTATLEWARRTPEAQIDNIPLLSWEVYQEHAQSLGMSSEQASQEFAATADWRMTFGGVCAVAGAGHFQFVARKEVLAALKPFKMERPMGQVRSLDVALNEGGYLRLGLCQPRVRHMGNTLPHDLEQPSTGGEPVQESGAQGSAVQRTAGSRPRSWGKRLVNFSPVRRSLMWLYHAIFRLYFEK